jgi:Flp pilus assembly protein TadD
MRAREALSEGSVSRACALGEVAAALAPSLPAARRFLGGCYMRLGEREKARQSYVMYLNLSPDTSDAPFIRAMISRP